MNKFYVEPVGNSARALVVTAKDFLHAGAEWVERTDFLGSCRVRVYDYRYGTTDQLNVSGSVRGYAETGFLGECEPITNAPPLGAAVGMQP